MPGCACRTTTSSGSCRPSRCPSYSKSPTNGLPRRTSQTPWPRRGARRQRSTRIALASPPVPGQDANLPAGSPAAPRASPSLTPNQRDAVRWGEKRRLNPHASPPNASLRRALPSGIHPGILEPAHFCDHPTGTDRWKLKRAVSRCSAVQTQYPLAPVFIRWDLVSPTASAPLGLQELGGAALRSEFGIIRCPVCRLEAASRACTSHAAG